MIWILLTISVMHFDRSLISAHQNGGEHYDLTVVVNNIKDIKGKIVMSVYNDPKVFPEYYKEYKLIRVDVTGLTATCTFKGLSEGEYAVAVFHDVNKDEICNLNFIGYPKEGFGFSNNVRPIVSAPSFNSCKLMLDADKSVKISLIH